MLLALCTSTAEAKSCTGRVTGVTRVGQDWQDAKLKIRWNAVRGAKAYQMRLVPKIRDKQLRRAKAVRVPTARGTYTRALNRTGSTSSRSAP